MNKSLNNSKSDNSSNKDSFVEQIQQISKILQYSQKQPFRNSFQTQIQMRQQKPHLNLNDKKEINQSEERCDEESQIKETKESKESKEQIQFEKLQPQVEQELKELQQLPPKSYLIEKSVEFLEPQKILESTLQLQPQPQQFQQLALKESQKQLQPQQIELQPKSHQVQEQKISELQTQTQILQPQKIQLQPQSKYQQSNIIQHQVLKQQQKQIISQSQSPTQIQTQQFHSHIKPGQPQSQFQQHQQPQNQNFSKYQSTKDFKSYPDFLNQYFGASRFHYLSTWKNELKTFAGQSSSSNPLIGTIKPTERTIMHVDMDCFFVSVSIKDRPSLKDKPVAVSHSKGGPNAAGQIASCNYPARSFGVKNGMFIQEAKRRCQDLVILPYEFDKYRRVSEKLYKILISFSDRIQAVSCDEALIDVSLKIPTKGLGEEIKLAKEIRKAIFEETDCTASIGISHNILLARLSTKKAKPDGEYYLSGKDVPEFLKNIKIEDLPNIGWANTRKFREINVSTCSDLLQLSLEKLQLEFGNKTGEMLFNFCRGIDNRELAQNQPRKSIGAEVNWAIRFEKNSEIRMFIKSLSHEVSKRLSEARMKGRAITLKAKRRKPNAQIPAKFLGHGLCDSFSRSVNLVSSTLDTETISKECWSLFQSLKIPEVELRGLGIHVSKLELLNERESSFFFFFFSFFSFFFFF